MLLQGKKAIITGGARGIGKEMVEAYLKNGADVYFMDLNPSEQMADLEKIASENGVRVVYEEANVADENQVNDVVDKILKDSGGIDILINNAGITRDGLIFRMPSEDWNLVLTINLTSAFYLSRKIAYTMIRQKSGSIINVSSIVGVHGNAGQCNYSASKAGLIGLTKSLGQEVASRGVRVNAIAPGFIDTPMTQKLSEEVRAGLLKQIPMKRLGDPKEIADVCLFLGSDLSRYVTGQVVGIDGGMGM
jgi:3-oxoacyl-[acyl-carrier protein] reductase